MRKIVLAGAAFIVGYQLRNHEAEIAHAAGQKLGKKLGVVLDVVERVLYGPPREPRKYTPKYTLDDFDSDS